MGTDVGTLILSLIVVLGPIILGLMIGIVVSIKVLSRLRNKQWYFGLWFPLTIISSLWLWSSFLALLGIIGRPSIFLFPLWTPMIGIFIGSLFSWPMRSTLSFKKISATIIVSISLLISLNSVCKFRKTTFLIIDQLNFPVENVELYYHTSNRRWNDWWTFLPFTKRKNKGKTNSNGEYTIKYYFFESLDLDQVRKSGYEIKRPDNWVGDVWEKKMYESNDHKVTIQAWEKNSATGLEKNKADHLIEHEYSFGVVTDNSLYSIDLINRRSQFGPSKQADIALQINAEPSGKYDWNFTITAISGGLIEVPPDTPCLFMAPESGYQKRLFFSFNEKNFQNEVKKKMYLRIRDKKLYASLDMTVYFYNITRGRFSIKSVVNPNGSRWLELNKPDKPPHF